MDLHAILFRSGLPLNHYVRRRDAHDSCPYQPGELCGVHYPYVQGKREGICRFDFNRTEYLLIYSMENAYIFRNR